MTRSLLRPFAVLLLVLYVVASWYPFRLDLPFRAEDVAVDDEGVWRFSGRSLAASRTPPAWLAPAIEGASLELSVEVRTASAQQHGPARILAVSQDTRSQNLMMGQEGPDLVVRVRRPGTGDLGDPPLVVSDVFSRSDWRRIDLRVGEQLQVSVDGVIGDTIGPIRGTFEPWDRQHRLALGNEHTWDRGWEGSIRSASVMTAEGRTDLLGTELVRTWDDAWVVPARIGAEDERGHVRRSIVWGLHGVFAMAMLFVVALGWPRYGWTRAFLAWTTLAIIVNLGKVVVDGRHPSVVTTVVQVAGGALGLAIATHFVGPGSRIRRAGSD